MVNRLNFRVWMRGELEDGRTSGRDMSYSMWYDHIAIIDGKPKRYSPCSSDWSTLDKEDHGDFVVMQSTGLTDIHGKEIYEGDILRFGYNDSTGDTYVVTVLSDDINSGTQLFIQFGNDISTRKYISRDLIKEYKLSVAGNIFEK